MADIAGRTALRGARRAAVVIIIVAVAICAVLGIFLLFSAWSDTQIRVLATAGVVALFATTALCHLAQVGRPLRVVGFAGIVASLLALAAVVVVIWTDWWTFGADAAGWIWKSAAVLAVLAGSLAQANLLLLLAGRHRKVVRALLLGMMVVIAIVAVMISLPVITDGQIPGGDGGDWYWRLFGTIVILDALGTIVLPVLGLILKDARPGFAVLTIQAPADLVARLDEQAAATGTTRADAVAAAITRGLDGV
jgi:hypothetical protein